MTAVCTGRGPSRRLLVAALLAGYTLAGALACQKAAERSPADSGAADADAGPLDESDGAPAADPTGEADPDTGGDDDTGAPADCFHPVAPTWHVCDGRLYDAQGRAVRLHGVNVSQARKHAPYAGGTSPEDLAAMRALGFDHVRLLWSWAAAMPEPDQLDAAYLDRLADEVGRVADAGLLVVLDAHQDLFGEAIRTADGPVGNGAPAWACPPEIADTFTQPVDPWFANYATDAVRGCFDNLLADATLQDAFATAWAAVAQRVGANPAVVGYDLWNEPFWGSHNLFSWEADWLLPLYERLGAAILAADPDALLFVEPGAQKNVSGRSSLPRPDFPEVVYAPHLYDANMEAGNAWSGQLDTFTARLTNDSGEAAAWDPAAPLYYGEWGTPGSHPNDPDFVRALADLLDAHGASWCIWQWGPGGPGSYALVDADLTPNADALALARPYPERLAGDALDLTVDPGTFALTASWTASSTEVPTVFVAPSATFPDGPRVTVTGGHVLPAPAADRVEVLADSVGARVSVSLAPR